MTKHTAFAGADGGTTAAAAVTLCAPPRARGARRVAAGSLPELVRRHADLDDWMVRVPPFDHTIYIRLGLACCVSACADARRRPT
jgi:hypothetical protein